MGTEVACCVGGWLKEQIKPFLYSMDLNILGVSKKTGNNIEEQEHSPNQGSQVKKQTEH